MPIDSSRFRSRSSRIPLKARSNAADSASIPDRRDADHEKDKETKVGGAENCLKCPTGVRAPVPSIVLPSESCAGINAAGMFGISEADKNFGAFDDHSPFLRQAESSPLRHDENAAPIPKINREANTTKNTFLTRSLTLRTEPRGRTEEAVTFLLSPRKYRRKRSRIHTKYPQKKRDFINTWQPPAVRVTADFSQELQL